MNRQQALGLVMVALGGLSAGALGMRYSGTWIAVLRDADDRQEHAGVRAMPGLREDATGRSGSETPGQDEKKLVRLTESQIKKLRIEIAVAQPGPLQRRRTLPGTIALNTDRLVHIVPRLPGVVREVRKHLGDAVRAGEVLAIIDSRELADAKAAYLATSERVSIAEITFAREKDLWEKKISPAQDYLTAKQALAEARIELRTARHKLYALGVAEAHLQQLASQPDTSLTRYEVVTPSAGTVIEKRLTVGEVLKDDTEAFVVADLSTVWVQCSVTPADLSLVHKGQRLTIIAGRTMPEAVGTIDYIGPVVSEETRTVLTRVVLPNTDGRWRPGLFVTATLVVSDTMVLVLIPTSALQTLDGQPNVFVEMPEGFEPRPVTLGRSSETHVEITAGLQTGERYATTETFLLKAELGKPRDTDD